jgi:ATP-dependent RNA helicase SUPV3L1/SUV3
MTSLVGCAGEDFAAILRALGYRMDRRPAPDEPAPAETPAASAETTSEAAAETPAVSETPAEAASEVAAAEAAPAETAGTETVSAATGAEAAVAEASKEPAMIEVWRPGRPPGERRAHKPHDRERKRPQHVSLPAQSASENAASDSNQEKSHGARRPRRHDGPRRHDRKPRHDNSHQDRSRDQPRREYRERRERPIDPNSPFAALLQLKARMQSASDPKNEPGKNDEEKSDS